jgi:hypothetical protein|tara:strand:- start:42 stop:236 length:195 start_codon:yes stop_codon:yes gene_type:complete
MRFGTIGYDISTFLVVVLLMSYTILMTLFINEQRGVEISTMLILYFNIIFICVLIQMNVSSKMS